MVVVVVFGAAVVVTIVPGEVAVVMVAPGALVVMVAPAGTGTAAGAAPAAGGAAGAAGAAPTLAPGAGATVVWANVCRTNNKPKTRHACVAKHGACLVIATLEHSFIGKYSPVSHCILA